MLKPARGLERWALINASPETVFAYLADLPRHGEWDAQTGFRMVRASDGPVAAGSYCQRERIETFQAPILRRGATNSRVSWVKSLTVTGCLSNQALDFEKKYLQRLVYRLGVRLLLIVPGGRQDFVGNDRQEERDHAGAVLYSDVGHGHYSNPNFTAICCTLASSVPTLTFQRPIVSNQKPSGRAVKRTGPCLAQSPSLNWPLEQHQVVLGADRWTWS